MGGVDIIYINRCKNFNNKSVHCFFSELTRTINQATIISIIATQPPLLNDCDKPSIPTPQTLHTIFQ